MIDIENQSSAANSTRQAKIALAAGHHNSDGGNQTEYGIVGPLTKTYATFLRQAGADVRVVTPNDGMGQFDGGLQDVAQVVVDWYNAGWEADIFMEVHTNGGGGNGAFGIYPDSGNDVDIDARDILIPEMIQAGCNATGLNMWSNGVMSEQQTGVGRQGYRLGIFLVTEAINETCTRLIIEHGAHDTDNLNLIRTQDFMNKWCAAVVPVMLNFCGQQTGSIEIPPDDNYLHENGYIVGGGFKTIVENLENVSHAFRLKILGQAISNEGDGYLLEPEIENKVHTGRYRIHETVLQKFERQSLIHNKNEPNAEWQDTAPLVNLGYLVGFSDDPAIDAVLKNPLAQWH